MKKQVWVNKFEVVGIVPGKIVFLGKTLDLSNENLPLEKVQKLFDSGCKYLKLKTEPEASTGTENHAEKAVVEPNNAADQIRKGKGRKIKKVILPDT